MKDPGGNGREGDGGGHRVGDDDDRHPTCRRAHSLGYSPRRSHCCLHRNHLNDPGGNGREGDDRHPARRRAHSLDWGRRGEADGDGGVPRGSRCSHSPGYWDTTAVTHKDEIPHKNRKTVPSTAAGIGTTAAGFGKRPGMSSSESVRLGMRTGMSSFESARAPRFSMNRQP